MSLLLLRSLPAGAFRVRHSPSSPLPFILAFRRIKSNPIASFQRRAIFSISASATSASETISISAHKHPLPPSSDANPAALEWVNRTAFCGELSEPDVRKRVRLCGWVALHRVHGALTFVTLRDHTGTVQVCLTLFSDANLFNMYFILISFHFCGKRGPETPLLVLVDYIWKIYFPFYIFGVSDNQVTTLPDEFPEAHSVMNGLRLEYVIAVEGFVRPRPVESINKNMKTGSIEVGNLFCYHSKSKPSYM